MNFGEHGLWPHPHSRPSNQSHCTQQAGHHVSQADWISMASWAS